MVMDPSDDSRSIEPDMSANLPDKRMVNSVQSRCQRSRSAEPDTSANLPNKKNGELCPVQLSYNMDGQDTGVASPGVRPHHVPCQVGQCLYFPCLKTNLSLVV